VPGLIASAQSTAGSLENIRSIQAGTLDAGIAQADLAAWSFRGSHALNITPADSLRALASLYPDALHIVVRADSPLHRLKDLQGKKIAIGDMASGNALSARLVLQAAGLSSDSKLLQQSPIEAGNALQQKKLDAFVVIGGAPMPMIRSLAAEVPLRFIPLSGREIRHIRKRFAWWTPYLIRHKAYGMIPSARTVAIPSILLVSADIDASLAHGLTRALWQPEALKILAASHPLDSELKPEWTLEDIPIPLHPGAERYYREAGLLTGDSQLLHAVR
jgi:hypothetical protein